MVAQRHIPTSSLRIKGPVAHRALLFESMYVKIIGLKILVYGVGLGRSMGSGALANTNEETI